MHWASMGAVLGTAANSSSVPGKDDGRVIGKAERIAALKVNKTLFSTGKRSHDAGGRALRRGGDSPRRTRTISRAERRGAR